MYISNNINNIFPLDPPKSPDLEVVKTTKNSIQITWENNNDVEGKN